MNYVIKDFDNLPKQNQESIAETIQNYTSGSLGESPQMLPVTKDEIYQKFAGKVALQRNEFVGFVGALDPIIFNNDSLSEVGTLWVPTSYRGKGIAARLITEISTTLLSKQIVPFAFCNPLSLPIFLATGYELANKNTLPNCVFEPCNNCPKKPQNGCCDTQVIYKEHKDVTK